MDTKVIELAFFYPAPFCTKILLDLGAEVIKIEPPGGDPARILKPFFTAINCGKKIVKIDLKSDAGREEFFRILEDADVFVESFRPGVAKRLGVDYESVKKVKEDIIYCSISAFGQKGKLANLPAHDINVLGVAGILEMTGYKDSNLLLADFSSAVFAAIMILNALLERERSGKGCYIDVSMFHSALYSIPLHSSCILNNFPLPIFTSNPAYRIYRTSDGFITLGIVAEEHFWERLKEVLKIQAGSLLESFSHFENLRDEIQKKLEKMKTKEALELLQKADIPAFELKSLKKIEEIEDLLGEKLYSFLEFEGEKFKVIKSFRKT